MKAVILAGGLGTRISEETEIKPKPMIEIGNMPIIWHIMKIYSAHGINDFIICCGYKGHVIKEYFSNYFLRTSDFSYSMISNDFQILSKNTEPWNITLIDTGENTMTGGRLKRVSSYLSMNEPFCFTYGDGVSNVNISELILFHKNNGTLATVTATRPPGRFGSIEFGKNNRVKKFKEKVDGDGSWINGGFFVLEPAVLELISDDNTVWEEGPLNILAEKGELSAFKHEGFWQPMDTLREKTLLNNLWNKNEAPWKIWE